MSKEQRKAYPEYAKFHRPPPPTPAVTQAQLDREKEKQERPRPAPRVSHSPPPAEPLLAGKKLLTREQRDALRGK